MADHREPQYNLSELAILRSLEADIRTSFKGHVFSEPINLLGLKRGQILDLTGAVFTEPVAVLTSTPSRVIIDEAQFFQGLVLQVNTDILSANGAIIHQTFHCSATRADQVSMENAQFPEHDTWVHVPETTDDIGYERVRKAIEQANTLRRFAPCAEDDPDLVIPEFLGNTQHKS